jgi:DnaJ-class molecular chaperone
MPDRKQPRCPYCLGEGKLPKVQAILSATHALPIEWQTCPGCGGTGQLKADDWREGDGAAGWEALGTM